MRGGTTVVAAWDGTVRYMLPKPLPHPGLSPAMREVAEARQRRQLDYVSLCDAVDLSSAYLGDAEYLSRMQRRTDLRSLHEGF
jgi:hypothetical protein